MTPEQRAEINRSNAKKSTGPKTDEGKAKSRMNAYRHGLRSEIVALESEDKAAVQARINAWREHYDPQSPAAEHLVTCCVRASLAADRAARHESALLNQQAREAFNDQLNAQNDEVEALLEEMKTNPNAVKRLRRTAHGCRYMIGRWENLREQLFAKPRWSKIEIDEATRLQAADPDRTKLREDEVSYLTHAMAVLCDETLPTAYLQNFLFHTANVPDGLRHEFRLDDHPAPESAREALLKLVDAELEKLRTAEAELREWFEEPAFAEVQDRALVVADPDRARLLLRYQSEARTAFTRAYRDLQSTLKADAARVETPPTAEPEAPAAPSPNEAKSPVEPSAAEPRSTNANANSSPSVNPSPSHVAFPIFRTPRDAASDAPDIRRVGPPSV